MFRRVVACCIGFTATFVLSAFGGPFDDSVGKYKGRGVERDSDGSVYYYAQTVKLEASSQTTIATLPGVATLREFISFRDDGTVSGSGSAPGYNFSWKARGRWKQQGEAIKATVTSLYSNGGYSIEKRIYRFKNGKLIMNVSGYSGNGLTMTSTYRGKLKESTQ